MIHLQELVYRYGSLTAVDGLSLKIADGEAFGLLGPNGAGKSTTIALCTGLLRPAAGSVTFNGGGSPTDATVRSRCGVAPQALALYEELTAEENLRFFGRLYGLGGGKLKERTAAVLDFAGLTDRAGDRVGTYSGGMKRRLNLAVALIHEPEILFLDEPTAGVDPQSRNLILDRIAELRDGGLTVIYSTHYMEEAERLCDRVAIIDHGRLIALGPVRELITEHGGPQVITAHLDGRAIEQETSDPAADLARLQEQGPLRDFHLRTPGLETVFLNLTGRTLRD